MRSLQALRKVRNLQKIHPRTHAEDLEHVHAVNFSIRLLDGASIEDMLDDGATLQRLRRHIEVLTERGDGIRPKFLPEPAEVDAIAARRAIEKIMIGIAQ